MSENSGYDLKPIHCALLDIYVEFRRFCEEHELIHYVDYGTLLGAVRHKGFIPWDDDFDVSMPRHDYEKLLALSSQLPPHLKWRSIETEPGYGLLFGKVQDTRSDLLEQVQKQSNLALGQGLFIDVFPLDGIPSSSIGMFYWRVRRALMRRFCTLERTQKWFASWSTDTCKYVGMANHEASSPARFRHLRSSWGNPVEMPFEDTTVLAPCQCAEVLTVNYGDWKRLPPEDSRVPSHQRLICT